MADGWLATPLMGVEVPGVEVHPVQLPGRQTRYDEALPADIRSLVPEIADAVLPLLDKPFAFVGNSTGALIAYELARYLELCFTI